MSPVEGASTTTAGSRVWTNDAIRDQILDDVQHPFGGNEVVVFTELAPLLTLDRMTFSVIVQRLYKVLHPNIPVCGLGLAGYMRERGAPEERIGIYVQAVRTITSYHQVDSVAEMRLQGYFEAYPMLDTVKARIKDVPVQECGVTVELRRGGCIRLSVLWDGMAPEDLSFLNDAYFGQDVGLDPLSLIAFTVDGGIDGFEPLPKKVVAKFLGFQKPIAQVFTLDSLLELDIRGIDPGASFAEARAIAQSCPRLTSLQLALRPDVKLENIQEVLSALVELAVFEFCNKPWTSEPLQVILKAVMGSCPTIRRIGLPLSLRSGPVLPKGANIFFPTARCKPVWPQICALHFYRVREEPEANVFALDRLVTLLVGPYCEVTADHFWDDDDAAKECSNMFWSLFRQVRISSIAYHDLAEEKVRLALAPGWRMLRDE